MTNTEPSYVQGAVRAGSFVALAVGALLLFLLLLVVGIGVVSGATPEPVVVAILAVGGGGLAGVGYLGRRE